MSDETLSRKKRRWPIVVGTIAVVVLASVVVVSILGPGWLSAPAREDLAKPWVAAEVTPGHLPESLAPTLRWLAVEGETVAGRFDILYPLARQPLSAPVTELERATVLETITMFREHRGALNDPAAWREVRPGYLEREEAVENSDGSAPICPGGVIGDAAWPLELLTVAAIRVGDDTFQQELRDVWAAATHVPAFTEMLFASLVEFSLRQRAIRWWSYLSRDGIAEGAVRPSPVDLSSAERVRRLVENHRRFLRTDLRAIVDANLDLGLVEEWRHAFELAAWYREDRACARFVSKIEAWNDPASLARYENEATSWLTARTVVAEFLPVLPEVVARVGEIDRYERALRVVLRVHDEPGAEIPEPFRTAVLSDGARILYDSSTTSAPASDAVTEDYLLWPYVSEDAWFLPSRPK